MHKTLSAALLALAMLSAISWSDARAMTLDAQMSAVARTVAPELTSVAMVCGRNGCAPVHVARIWHQPPSFARTAVPLTVPKTNVPLNAPANK